MNKGCDLHTHSIFSDGTWTPEEMIEEGERLGLSAVALTDHNTVAGLPRFLEAAKGKKIRAIPGIEMTTEYEGRELHIIGLMVEPEHYGPINERLQDFLVRKDRSNQELVDALNRDGFSLDYDAIRREARSEYINRAHIAAELTRQGRTSTIQEAFATLLRPECGYYHPPKRPDAIDTICFLRELGVAPVFAHPFLSLKEPMLSEFLKKAVPAGLIAMEAVYSTYNKDTTERAFSLIDQFSILPSGGSDFHGDKKPDIQLGTGRGNLLVPNEFLDRILWKLTN